MWIGAHVSIAKGFFEAVQTVVEMKGNTLQFFTRNPRGGKARALVPEEIRAAHDLMKIKNFGLVVAHAPYTYNLASAKKGVREFSRLTIQEDLLRIKAMGVPYLVLHVGSHGGQGEEKGLALVIEGLREILADLPDETMLLLEGMSGQGTELGYTFEQLAAVILACDNNPGLGVCLDSCHLTGAGYDLADWVRIKGEFDKIVGWDKLKAFHLNDSLFPLGSRRDRHAKLGEGYLGLATIKKIICDQDLQKIPLILETPNDNLGYAREIVLIREACS
ncbi:MAG: deoxyribonuclease IV [Clostridia bacterium]|nr:deoxyribonuclease IV [Clostridia bacterium]MDD4145494.1 deoxyribonuclease IV [Clostridia bacterium]MDD4665913.1 deoxyribonuclease IV [Clostridia bacterium]